MSNKILDKVKYIIGLDDLEDDDLLDVEESDDIQEIEMPISQNSKRNNKIVNIHTNSQMKLVIHEPKKFEDSPKIVDDLKSRKITIINLETLDGELKKQIFDFLSGAVYTLEGNIQKVAKDIFILAPNNVEINGKIKEELKSKGLFPWQK